MMPPLKRRDRATLPCPHLTAIPDEIGDYIARDARLARDLGREGFIKERRGQGDF